MMANGGKAALLLLASANTASCFLMPVTSIRFTGQGMPIAAPPASTGPRLGGLGLAMAEGGAGEPKKKGTVETIGGFALQVLVSSSPISPN